MNFSGLQFPFSPRSVLSFADVCSFSPYELGRWIMFDVRGKHSIGYTQQPRLMSCLIFTPMQNAGSMVIVVAR